jgi:hypothetical protein
MVSPTLKSLTSLPSARYPAGLDYEAQCLEPRISPICCQLLCARAEHPSAIASYLGWDSVAPTDLRCNIVIRGINLLALEHRRFRPGTAVLEYTGECHPCSRMEENLPAMSHYIAT